jgi:protein O-GlcNAc transferase
MCVDEIEQVRRDLDPAHLANITARLGANRLAAPLFDTELFARHLEDAYVQMYERYLADAAPEHIWVRKLGD